MRASRHKIIVVCKRQFGQQRRLAMAQSRRWRGREPEGSSRYSTRQILASGDDSECLASVDAGPSLPCSSSTSYVSGVGTERSRNHSLDPLLHALTHLLVLRHSRRWSVPHLRWHARVYGIMLLIDGILPSDVPGLSPLAIPVKVWHTSSYYHRDSAVWSRNRPVDKHWHVLVEL
ncbi:hypothetical protein BJV78DRAFT_789180 [Lactifluus subvellereus]|nr:hypothetical protein BJV78DRAFT_789180 [Lactifluus subvellereus]